MRLRNYWWACLIIAGWNAAARDRLSLILIQVVTSDNFPGVVLTDLFLQVHPFAGAEIQLVVKDEQLGPGLGQRWPPIPAWRCESWHDTAAHPAAIARSEPPNILHAPDTSQPWHALAMAGTRRGIAGYHDGAAGGLDGVSESLGQEPCKTGMARTEIFGSRYASPSEISCTLTCRPAGSRVLQAPACGWQCLRCRLASDAQSWRPYPLGPKTSSAWWRPVTHGVRITSGYPSVWSECR